jgi:hypothetical protein
MALGDDAPNLCVYCTANYVNRYIHVDMRRYSMTLRIVNGIFHLYLVVWTASDLDLVEGYELEAIRYLTGREGSSPVVFADVHEEVPMGTDRPLLR